MASCHYHIDGAGATRRVVATIEYPVDEPPNRMIIDDTEYVRRRFCVIRRAPDFDGYECTSCWRKYKGKLKHGSFCTSCGAEVIG